MAALAGACRQGALLPTTTYTPGTPPYLPQHHVCTHARRADRSTARPRPVPLQDVKPSPEVQRGRHERDFEAHQAMLGRLAALRCRGGRHDCGDWSDGGEAGGGRQG